MRLLTFQRDGVARPGIAAGDYALDIPGASDAMNMQGLSECPDILTLIRLGEPAIDSARRLLADAEREIDGGHAEALVARGLLHPLNGLRLMAPVPNPSKVVAIGLNYRDHAREQGAPIPDRPIIFAKFPTSVIGPGDTITWDPALTQQVDYEAELAVVIGETARNVSEEDACSVVAGYTCGNDVSARDLQFGDRQWVRGKSLDTFCPLGPVLVTPDEVADPQGLAIRAVLNGEVMQDSSTSEMIFGVRELIAFASRAFTLLPGDVVLTGTPHGVGVFRQPPVFLGNGDRIAVEIEKIGRLENVCRTAAGDESP
jgi:2-keto-4-pentenoate hydratase/2-oxohepta-3-ene-1,7-dioic acid hydratase in catechol pathway